MAMTGESAGIPTPEDNGPPGVRSRSARLDAGLCTFAQLAASMCGTPAASVEITGVEAMWGLWGSLVPSDAPIGLPLIGCASSSGEVFEVSDAPDIAASLRDGAAGSSDMVRFYAHVPLLSSGGTFVGTLAVFDRVPRRLSELQREALRLLGRLSVIQLQRVADQHNTPQKILEPSLLADASKELALRESGAHVHAVGQRTVSTVHGDPVIGQPGSVHAEERGRSPYKLLEQPKAHDQNAGPPDMAPVMQPGVDGELASGSRINPDDWRSDIRKLALLNQSTFEQVPIGIAYAGPDGRFLWCNRACGLMLQLTPGELV